MSVRNLNRTQPVAVEFDPNDAEHQRAFLMLVMTGKQHPTLRFHVDAPFTNAPMMMALRLALVTCADTLRSDYNLDVDAAIDFLYERDQRRPAISDDLPVLTDVDTPVYPTVERPVRRPQTNPIAVPA